jgi:hypothetical protein
VLLNIALDQPLETARLKKAQRVSANRYHNEVVVASADELDGELMGWVRGAYRLTG